VVVSDVKRAERTKVLATFAPSSGSVVPALAVSSYRRGADHLEFLADGFHLHLTKPLSAAELAQAVRALVPAPRSVEPGGSALEHVERRSS
jgi:CheY-like chemotaxis protein